MRSTLTCCREDEGEINPSPWYGFRIEPKSDELLQLNITLTYPLGINHRYHPKTSTDGSKWTPIQEDAIVVGEETASFDLVVDGVPLYVSAQENLDFDWYHDWYGEIEEDWRSGEFETIGYSIAKHPIVAFETNSCCIQSHCSYRSRASARIAWCHGDGDTSLVPWHPFARTCVQCSSPKVVTGSRSTTF